MEFLDALLKRVDLPEDAFDGSLMYNPPKDDQPFEVLSLGLDGKTGGEGIDADISNLPKKDEEKKDDKKDDDK